MRRFIKRLLRADGTVSVYLMLIIVPIFLFNGIFIDYSRIRLAEKQSESATKAAARSTLSAFETKVQAYGLFGQGQSPQQNRDLFEQVLTANLSARNESRFRYVEPALVPDSVHVQHLYTLGDQVVFKRQVLDDMKYKAPVEFALNVVDKLKKTKVTDQLQQASRFAKLSQKIEDLLEKRDSRLDEAWDETTKLKGQLAAYRSDYRSKLQELNELAGKIGLHTLAEVKNSLDEITARLTDLSKQRDDTNEEIAAIGQTIAAIAMGGGDAAALAPLFEQQRRLAEAVQELSGQIAELAEEKQKLTELLQNIIKYTELVAEIKEHVAKDDEQVLAMEQRLNGLISEARQLDKQIREEIAGGGEAAANGPDALGESGDRETLPAELSLQNIALGDDYFDEYQTGIGAAVSAFHGFRQQLTSASLFLDDPYERLIADNDGYADIMERFYSSFQAKEQARAARRDNARQKKKEASASLESALDKAKEEITGCPSAYAESAKSAYDRLQGDSAAKGLYPKYMEYNDNAEQADAKPEIADAGRAGKVAFDLIDRLLAALEGARDKLYVNEFALTKFNYRTLEKAVAKGVDSNKLPDPAGHALQLQEAEYILYGFYSCEANYSAAYAEMFTLRLAIRTLESLMEPQNELLNAGSPLLVLLAALAEGAAKAYDDMVKLLDGDNVPVMKKLGDAVTMNYKDYLRLFLFLHSSDQSMMSRMQALIELNTGEDLTGLATYVQGTDTTSIRLWFIPVAVKVLNRVGALECTVKQNRCEMTQTAALAY